MNATIIRLAFGEIMLSVSIFLLLRVVDSHEKRIYDMEKVRIKTTEELINEANRLIATGKAH